MNESTLFISHFLGYAYDENAVSAEQLFPGIDLIQVSISSATLQCNEYPDTDGLMLIYCRTGHMNWVQDGDTEIHLGHGDFVLAPLNRMFGTELIFPSEMFEGLLLMINPNTMSAYPPEILNGTGVTADQLKQKFCADDSCTTIHGNEQTDRIFAGFFDQPEQYEHAYRQLMTLELFMYLVREEIHGIPAVKRTHSEQISIIREVHAYLLDNMDLRITIDMLAHRFLMNPTTLKQVFKDVYGNSIAAHIKEHRMEKALIMLRESDCSLSEIAKAVGYDSQSKFTAAFKAYYKVLPSAYRKQN